MPPLACSACSYAARAAVLHRQEGDLPNARYWYARCNRRLRKGVTPDAELREIEKALGQ